MSQTPLSPTAAPLEIFSSRTFIEWLQEQHISLAFTTYQTGQLILLGVNSEGRLSGFQRLFNRAMGLYATTERLYLSTKYQLWQLDNVLEPGQQYNGYDKLYVPRIGYTTGDLDIHDVAIEQKPFNQGWGYFISPPPATPSLNSSQINAANPTIERVIFVSSLLNSLATISQRNSCTPLWKPPFISKVINEDRCHLNGLAVVEGKPRYVTACGQSDVIDGWRDRRQSSGCLIDVQSNEVILQGLSMPHSPRFYQGKLWLLNSGSGELGYVDTTLGKFEPITFCPGYLRGLAFWKNFAIVGLSKPRGGDKTFSGLMLDEQLMTKNAEPRCGLMVIDLNNGSIVDWLRLEGAITELYDVQVLPNVRQPMALGFQTDEISRLLTLDPLWEA